jgi:hypothetical protein
MKILKALLHYWFAFISVVSFLVGWGMLAHSLKPIQPTQNATNSSITQLSLPPIQAFGSGGSANIPSTGNSTTNQFTVSRPRLRSGGS